MPLVPALRTARSVPCCGTGPLSLVDITVRDTEPLVRLVDLRATGDGRIRTWWDLVVRLNAAGDVQAIEFLNRLFLPSSPDF
jgi:hypothetical protein